MALTTTPDPIRTALNRLTFGARDTDVTRVRGLGLSAWMAEQFTVPSGDDPALASFLATQELRITYPAPAAGSGGTWDATDEMRPLSYLNASTQSLWDISVNAGTKYHFNERLRIRSELLLATWIRNIHSRFQLREFMADFWQNHFNIGKNENQFAVDLLPVYDRVHIRPFVFGNFRQLLESTATASSMMLYLDNAASTAVSPNENYAREIMELHTMGGEAYLGINPTNVPTGPDGVATGFTDQDVLQAARALSGWTVNRGQRLNKTTLMPNNGLFTFQPLFHNTQATSVMKVNLAGLSGMAQAEKFLDVIAYHPATAKFIVTKICKRMFGDAPPQAAIDRGIAAWNANKTASNQIRKVLEAIVLGGSEISTATKTKVRRPYERLVAYARTLEMTVNVSVNMLTAFDSVNDGPFIWGPPNGRPDFNGYWLGTGATLRSWNQTILFPTWVGTESNLRDQTPVSALPSATAVTEYWVGRLVGHALSSASMTALIDDQAGLSGIPKARFESATVREQAHRRLVSLIATTEEFSYR